jgi:hypothetical protein
LIACTTHCDRLTGKFRPVPNLDGSIETIHVQMDDDAGHGYIYKQQSGGSESRRVVVSVYEVRRQKAEVRGVRGEG